jgi:hypothetical protein
MDRRASARAYIADTGVAQADVIGLIAAARRSWRTVRVFL